MAFLPNIQGIRIAGSLTGITSITVTGNTSLQSVTATTISATTYQNLPLDIRVTGGTYNSGNGIATFTNNTGGTFSVTGLTTPFTGGTVNGLTNFTNGLSANSLTVNGVNITGDTFVTGGTYNNSTGTLTLRNNQGNALPNITGFTTSSGGGFGSFLPLSGGTVSGGTSFISGLTATTISAITIQFDTSYAGSVGVGQIAWDTNFGTLQQGLVGGNLIQKIGETSFCLVKNVDSTTLNKGEVVYIFGATGDKISVKRASNTGDTTSSKTLGVVAETIDVNQNGLVMTQGTLDGLNLGAYNPGDILWLDSTPGQFTNIKRYAPYHLVFIGVVQRANNGNGQLYVKPQNGYEFNELHDVAISGQSNNDIPYWDASLGLWKNTNRPVFTSLTASTISATTYQNLPLDIRVTGGTYNSVTGVATFTNNTGGTFTVNGFSTGGGSTFTGGTVNGATNFTNGLTANSLTVNGVNITGDTFVTGGTYNSGTATFTNNNGGTFDVSGFSVAENLWTIGSSGSFSLKTINGSNLDATADYALAEGYATTASGVVSHAEGICTTASGSGSHAEGGYYDTINVCYVPGGFACNCASHAEGICTTSSGIASHAEGICTTASDIASHSEGICTTASDIASHSEGICTTASRSGSHAEGGYYDTDNCCYVPGGFACGCASHAEGICTTSSGIASHSEGICTTAIGCASHAEGTGTTASGCYSHAEGYLTTSSSCSSHAEGYYTIACGWASHAEGGYIDDKTVSYTIASGNASHAEGYSTTASGVASHAEGQCTISCCFASHAEGEQTTASGCASHAEGASTTASGVVSHAEGASTTASGDYSHAEGVSTIASGDYSHAEGRLTTASCFSSHAEGRLTTACGDYSHAGGRNSVASGCYSFVHGSGSTACGTNTIVLGANITGATANTTFVDRFNIKTIGSGSSLRNLGIDSSGNVVSGSTDFLSFNRITGTTYTAATSDVNNVIEMNSGSANILTVPPNSAVTISNGVQIIVAQYGSGQTTIQGGSGVTLRSAGGFLKLAAQYSMATLIKVDTNEWYVSGQLTA